MKIVPVYQDAQEANCFVVGQHRVTVGFMAVIRKMRGPRRELRFMLRDVLEIPDRKLALRNEVHETDRTPVSADVGLKNEG